MVLSKHSDLKKSHSGSTVKTPRINLMEELEKYNSQFKSEETRSENEAEDTLAVDSAENEEEVPVPPRQRERPNILGKRRPYRPKPRSSSTDSDSSQSSVSSGSSLHRMVLSLQSNQQGAGKQTDAEVTGQRQTGLSGSERVTEAAKTNGVVAGRSATGSTATADPHPVQLVKSSAIAQQKAKGTRGKAVPEIRESDKCVSEIIESNPRLLIDVDELNIPVKGEEGKLSNDNESVKKKTNRIIPPVIKDPTKLPVMLPVSTTKAFAVSPDDVVLPAGDGYVVFKPMGMLPKDCKYTVESETGLINAVLDASAFFEEATIVQGVDSRNVVPLVPPPFKLNVSAMESQPPSVQNKAPIVSLPNKPCQTVSFKVDPHLSVSKEKQNPLKTAGANTHSDSSNVDDTPDTTAVVTLQKKQVRKTVASMLLDLSLRKSASSYIVSTPDTTAVVTPMKVMNCTSARSSTATTKLTSSSFTLGSSPSVMLPSEMTKCRVTPTSDSLLNTTAKHVDPSVSAAVEAVGKPFDKVRANNYGLDKITARINNVETNGKRKKPLVTEWNGIKLKKPKLVLQRIDPKLSDAQKKFLKNCRSRTLFKEPSLDLTKVLKSRGNAKFSVPSVHTVSAANMRSSFSQTGLQDKTPQIVAIIKTPLIKTQDIDRSPNTQATFIPPSVVTTTVVKSPTATQAQFVSTSKANTILVKSPNTVKLTNTTSVASSDTNERPKPSCGSANTQTPILLNALSKSQTQTGTSPQVPAIPQSVISEHLVKTHITLQAIMKSLSSGNLVQPESVFSALPAQTQEALKSINKPLFELNHENAIIPQATKTQLLEAFLSKVKSSVPQGSVKTPQAPTIVAENSPQSQLKPSEGETQAPMQGTVTTFHNNVTVDPQCVLPSRTVANLFDSKIKTPATQSGPQLSVTTIQAIPQTQVVARSLLTGLAVQTPISPQTVWKPPSGLQAMAITPQVVSVPVISALQTQVNPLPVISEQPADTKVSLQSLIKPPTDQTQSIQSSILTPQIITPIIPQAVIASPVLQAAVIPQTVQVVLTQNMQKPVIQQGSPTTPVVQSRANPGGDSVNVKQESSVS